MFLNSDFVFHLQLLLFCFSLLFPNIDRDESQQYNQTIVRRVGHVQAGAELAEAATAKAAEAAATTAATSTITTTTKTAIIPAIASIEEAILHPRFGGRNQGASSQEAPQR